jgi:hypothetical protein
VSARGRVIVAIVLVAGSYVGCALLPYTGIAYDFSQTMYSGLHVGQGGNNHLFMPQAAWVDVGVAVAELRATIGGAPASADDRTRATFLVGSAHPNLEAVRVAVAGLCDAGHTVALDYRLPGTRARRSSDACLDPFFAPHRWVPFRLHPIGRNSR